MNYEIETDSESRLSVAGRGRTGERSNEGVWHRDAPAALF